MTSLFSKLYDCTIYSKKLPLSHPSNFFSTVSVGLCVNVIQITFVGSFQQKHLIDSNNYRVKGSFALGDDDKWICDDKVDFHSHLTRSS